VASISTFGESPREESYRGIDFREIGESGGKSTSAIEVAKPRGRSGAVDFSDRSRPLIVFTVEGHPSDVTSGFGESGIRRTRGRLHLDIRNPEIPKGGKTEVM
jgi:hypothetical protein